MDFIKANYEWIFSGIGVFIISLIIVKLFHKKKYLISKKTTMGDGSPIIDGKDHQVYISVRKRK